MRKLLLILLWSSAAFAQIVNPGGGSGGGSGTVTNIATGCGVTGGPVTTTGAISGTGPCISATSGGAAQAQTATYSPANTSLVNGLWLCWTPANANTGAGATFAPDGLTAHTIVKQAAAALAANDIITTAKACAIYDSTGTQWELQNPQTTSSGLPSGCTGSTGEISCTGGFAAGSSPPSVTVGTGGGFASGEGTAPSAGPASGVDLCYADSTQHGLLCSFNNGSYLPPVQGPASATSGHLAVFSGTNGGLIIDGGIVPNTTPGVTITTGTSATLSTPYTFNQEATAAQAVAYTLPTASAGAQYCVDNSQGSGGANTGALTVNASASGQYIEFTDGSYSASGGYLVSPGAARDGGCFAGIDGTHWMFYNHNASGVAWTKH